MPIANVFTIAVGPAVEPGLSPRQLKTRQREIDQLIRARIPSIRLLDDDQLRKRFVTIKEVLYLTFDLHESRQMSLFDPKGLPVGKRVAAGHSALYFDLVRLREEAADSIIRVGDLAMLSARLGALPDADAREALAALAPQDQDLWRLMHRRSGKPASIDFDDGNLSLVLPTLGMHLPEPATRSIRFRVKKIGRKSAILSGIREIVCGGSSADPAGNCPARLKLLRPSDYSLAHPDHWFLLYVAEYLNLPVEATVRMALSRVDLSPCHLELIEISNTEALVAEFPGFANGRPR